MKDLFINTETDVAQNLIDYCQRTFPQEGFQVKKNRGGLISEKMEVLYAELNEKAEAANRSYSVTGNF